LQGDNGGFNPTTRFKAKRCSSLEDVRYWIEEEQKGNTDGQKNIDLHGLTQTNTDFHRRTWTNTDRAGKNPLSVPVSAGRLVSVESPVLVANAALSLLNLCCYFLDRQLDAQAKAFEREGGFTERLYNKRSQTRKNQ
jgi:four helix bundle suffix protein